MEKVVPLFKLFNSIFYLQILSKGSPSFNQINSILIEFFLNNYKTLLFISDRPTRDDLYQPTGQDPLVFPYHVPLCLGPAPASSPPPLLCALVPHPSPPNSSPCFSTKIHRLPPPPVTKFCSPHDSDDTRAIHPSLSLPHCLLSDPEHRITVFSPGWRWAVAAPPHFGEINLLRPLILLALSGLPPHVLTHLPKLQELPQLATDHRVTLATVKRHRFFPKLLAHHCQTALVRPST
jgi:hypothetical protein